MKGLLDAIAPVRPPGEARGYRRLLGWAALPVVDRRWTAPLCALALGFGIFAGVAIGPGASGTLATGAPQVIELPGPSGGGGGGGGDAEVGTETSGEGGEAFGGGEGTPAEEPLEGFEEGASFSGLEAGFEEEATVGGEEKTPPAQPTEPAAGGEAAAGEEAEPVSGVVVHLNPAAGSYAIAAAGGALEAIHAPKLPQLGSRLTVPTRVLSNGSLIEAGKRAVKGKVTATTLTGIVTFVDPDPAAPAYTVSKRGVSALVRVHPDPTGAVPPLPQLGAYATVEVEIEKLQAGATPPVPPPVQPAPAAAPACSPDPVDPPQVPAAAGSLWQADIEADGAPFSSSDLAGIVMAACPEEGLLLISADDLRESGKDVLVSVPKSIDTAKLKPGDSIVAMATIEAGGALRLTGLASDERSKGADDGAGQGDLAPQKAK